MASLLIVDDDVDTGDLLADLLRDEGHDVQVARNGREGVAQLRARGPDLVLLDVEMPVLTGPRWPTRCSRTTSAGRGSPSFCCPGS